MAELDRLAAHLGACGLTEPGDIDLFTALGTGLTDQQISNDPGGDRWIRLIDDAVDMLVDHIEKRAAHATRSARANGTRTHAEGRAMSTLVAVESIAPITAAEARVLAATEYVRFADLLRTLDRREWILADRLPRVGRPLDGRAQRRHGVRLHLVRAGRPSPGRAPGWRRAAAGATRSTR